MAPKRKRGRGPADKEEDPTDVKSSAVVAAAAAAAAAAGTGAPPASGAGAGADVKDSKAGGDATTAAAAARAPKAPENRRLVWLRGCVPSDVNNEKEWTPTAIKYMRTFADSLLLLLLRRAAEISNGGDGAAPKKKVKKGKATDSKTSGGGGGGGDSGDAKVPGRVSIRGLNFAAAEAALAQVFDGGPLRVQCKTHARSTIIAMRNDPLDMFAVPDWIAVANNGGEPINHYDPEHSINPAKVFCDMWEFCGDYLTAIGGGGGADGGSTDEKQIRAWHDADEKEWGRLFEARSKIKARPTTDWARKHAEALAQAAKAALPPEPDTEWGRIKECVNYCVSVTTSVLRTWHNLSIGNRATSSQPHNSITLAAATGIILPKAPAAAAASAVGAAPKKYKKKALATDEEKDLAALIAGNVTELGVDWDEFRRTEGAEIDVVIPRMRGPGGDDDEGDDFVGW